MSTENTPNSSTPNMQRINAMFRKSKKILAVNKIRGMGMIPAVIFGKNMESLSIKIDYLEFQKVKNLLEPLILIIEKHEYNVTISSLQRAPMSKEVLHISFQKL